MAPWSIGIDFGHGETSVAALNLAQLQVQTAPGGMGAPQGMVNSAIWPDSFDSW